MTNQQASVSEELIQQTTKTEQNDLTKGWSTDLQRAELIQIYEIFVQTITAAEIRRQQTTASFIVLIAGLLASIEYINQIDPVFPVLGVLVIAVIWKLKISFFKDLASAKWRVCLELEGKLGATPFRDEYKLMKAMRRKSGNRHLRLTDIENSIPVLIAIGCLAYFVYRLLSYFAV